MPLPTDATVASIPGEQDLGPLAWVVDELRHSLDASVRALRRFVRDAEAARDARAETLDITSLRTARQHLHQAGGALEMVGMSPVAVMVRAMEAVVQKFVQRPELCSDDAAGSLERASFAVSEYLDAVLAGKATRSAVGLFPQFRDLQSLAGSERAHPADLWPIERRHPRQIHPAYPEPEQIAPLPYAAASRGRLDQAVLRIVKDGDPEAARSVAGLAAGFAAASAQASAAQRFWHVCAAFFEALAGTCVPLDVYVKRVASRVLMQYTALSRSDPDPANEAVSERLLQDLLFYCSQARMPSDAVAARTMPSLVAVRRDYQLAERFEPIDYETWRFGRFDPAMLAQARKRIASAAEAWSALAGGDRQKLKAAAEQLGLVGESLRRLHPDGARLAQALTQAVEDAVQANAAPSTALAMEVATSILYLQAAYEEPSSLDQSMPERSELLAGRLDRARVADVPEPLESWMEDLYRRVNDRQTMGSVVEELRQTLHEVETSLDRFFRDPQATALLSEVPGRLSQMRGVLSVLGLDQASTATLRMRDAAERLLAGDLGDDAEARVRMFDKLGSSLGALGFLIDMLSYQPALARKLFVYDDALGELRILMGRQRRRLNDSENSAAQERRSTLPPSAPAGSMSDLVAPAAAEPSAAAPQPARAPQAAPPATAAPPASPVPPETGATAPAAGIPPEFAHADAVRDLPPSAPRPSAPPPPADDIDDDLDLREIFLEEAREVLAQGRDAIHALSDAPAVLGSQTALRRAFHTLKGSGRMVGLAEFGEAAWALEQVLNAWLADQRPATEPLLRLCDQAFTALENWTDDIAAGDAGAWSAEPFRRAGEAMRTQQHRLDIAPIPEVEIPMANLSPQAPVVGGDVTGGTGAADTAGAIQAREAAPDADFDWERALSEEDAADFADTLPPDAEDEPFSFGLPAGAEAGAPEPSADPGPGPVADAAPAPGLQDMAAAFAAFDAALAHDASAPVSARAGEDAPRAATASLPAPDRPAGADAERAEGEPADALPDFSAFAAALDSDLAAADTADRAQVSPPSDAPVPVLLSPEDGTDWREVVPPADPVREPPPADTAADAANAFPAEPAADASARVRTIGPLRISTPLYHVYMAEAVDWSQRLLALLDDWSHAPYQPMPEAPAVLAHSLAGGSATVGFHALSELSRTLEHALQHGRLLGPEAALHTDAFTGAARDIQRLLTGFGDSRLGTPQPAVMEALQAVLDSELPDDALSLFGDTAFADSVRQGGEEAPSALISVPTEPTRSPARPEGESVDALPVLEDSLPVGELQDYGVPVDAPDRAADADAGAGPLLPPAPVSPSSAPARAVDGRGASEAQDAAAFANDHEDIDAVDDVDADLFPIFEEEALELLPALGGNLRRWTARPDDGAARAVVLRALHTLKGSARLAGAMHLGEQAHRFESAIESLGSEATIDAGAAEALLARFDAMSDHFDRLRTRVARGDVPETASAVFDGEAEPDEAPPLLEAPAEAAGAPDGAGDAPPARREPAAGPAPSAPAASAAPTAPLGTSVRVRARLLDRLVNQVGEVMGSRSRLESHVGQMRGALAELDGNLGRLRQQLRDVELQAETQMQSRLALTRDAASGFDPLEFDRFTRVQELTRMMAESVNDVATVQRNLQRAVEGAEDEIVAQGRQARELQHDLLRTRMVEFEGISERLYAVARQTAKETGKQIKLDIVGGRIEMDRGVLERMAPAFEHLLRNAVVHGIEPPEARTAAGKPATGTITIGLHHEGNDVAVEFRDDGAGLDLDRIRERAHALGLVGADVRLDDRAATDLIFSPGFSTAEQVTGLAGRGIGMDVVRAEVQSLGGRIQTDSAPGQGAGFRMVLPLTTAVTRVVMLRAGALVIGVPAGVVEQVRRVSTEERDAAYRDASLRHDGEAVPFFWAGALLRASAASREAPARSHTLVVLRSASQRLAVHVDEVLGNQEVVVKNLGPQLSRLPGLAGMSVLPSGATVLIYNLVALSVVYGARVRADLAATAAAQAAGGGAGLRPGPAEQGEEPTLPLVLVVDDSITVRRVTQRLLRREGYRVALATDGLQALERLQEERPALVLSDIEMPRMDGFDLARNIRADARWRDLPIVMITSRLAPKHRDHAQTLGVDHYLGKPYPEEELMALVRRYCAPAVA